MCIFPSGVSNTSHFQSNEGENITITQYMGVWLHCLHTTHGSDNAFGFVQLCEDFQSIKALILKVFFVNENVKNTLYFPTNSNLQNDMLYLKCAHERKVGQQPNRSLKLVMKTVMSAGEQIPRNWRSHLTRIILWQSPVKAVGQRRYLHLVRAGTRTKQ